ncbi:MAG: adenosylmethionine--8-amino-7-oxononanoate transaminase [Deltaproteobacteria bacterium TMED126]|jgi:adenosylmethionine-8-amino-7-oxononanoate transaminase|nr:adenosylmethionine--8-amino-7-oxononanoate transaminase [Candidatus Dadabacteria bacterium]NSW97377.1 adenosylmethionine--8-amino-7-oxononanoate transaminase [Deltaproteobacteria bacterium TMED126]|tara:strand:- start:12681 stop:14003 length:1323 start_codon:yes stop_codon:yes gene_type:complete
MSSNSKIKEYDLEYIWHPFTQMKEYKEEDPLVIEDADGVYLIDSEGNKYIDGVSSLWVNIHGHKAEKINNAIKKQVDKIAHSTLLGITNPSASILAKKLIDISPTGLKKVFYSGDGASAVEVGLKMAFQYWLLKGKPNKNKFICLKDGYHGDTLGAVSVGGIDLFHSTFEPLLFQSFKINSYDSTEKMINELELILKDKHEEIAGFILEPYVQAAGGMKVADDGYLSTVRTLCDKYDILLILDEVATGFGRTGKMFACEHDAITPDMLILGKGLTGGYLPLSATITTNEIFETFLGDYEELKAFFHGHSYSGNPLSCAAAIANIEIFEEEKTLESLKEKIAIFEDELKEFKGLSNVASIRNKGLMAGIDLKLNVDEDVSYSIKDRIGKKVCENAMKDGVLIRPLGDTIVLMPPISIKPDELKKLTRTVYKSIKEITEKDD